MKLVIQSKVQEPPHLIASKERRICPGTWSIKDLVDMIVATFPVARGRSSIHHRSSSHAQSQKRVVGDLRQVGEGTASSLEGVVAGKA